MIRRTFAAALLLAALATPAASAERRALLIGVSDYAPEVRALAPPLQGPGNDVALLAATLRAEWSPAARIVILSDRPDLLGPADRAAARTPTRAAILAAMADLVAATGPGDEVFVHLSGHGAQLPAPAEASDEADGLDEIFLPADFRLDRQGEAIALDNTLRDDAIGAFAAEIARRGAFLWLVVDACHSGSMLRDSRGDATPRRLDLAAPGLRVVDLTPQAPAPRPAGGPREGSAALDGMDPPAAAGGSFVGFFAAPPGTLAYETPFEGAGPDAARTVHGVLTWSLVAALRARDAQSYADLARDVTARIWGLAGVAGAPVFAGDLAARPMAGAGGARSDGIRRVALRSEDGALTALAGRIDGLRPGLRLSLRRRGGSDGPPLVIAEATEVGLDRARLRPLAETGELDAVLRAEGLDPARYRDRWLADRAADLHAEIPAATAFDAVAIAPPPADLTPPALADALRRLAAEPGVLVRDDPGGQSDLRVEVARGAFRLVPTEGAADDVPAVSLAGLDAEGIAAALRPRIRTQALLSVAHGFSGSDLARSLRTTVRRRPGDATPGGACPIPGRDARPAPDDLPVFDSATLVQRGITRHCDLVFLEIGNGGAAAVDVSVFYIDPAGGVFFLDGYAGSELGGLRVPPGETRGLAYVEDLAGTAETPAPAGPVELLVLAVPADPTAPAPRDFRRLQGAPEPPAALRAADARADGLAGLLAGAGFPPAYRGAAASPLDRAGAAIVPLRTVDPPGAGATQ